MSQSISFPNPVLVWASQVTLMSNDCLMLNSFLEHYNQPGKIGLKKHITWPIKLSNNKFVRLHFFPFLPMAITPTDCPGPQGFPDAFK